MNQKRRHDDTILMQFADYVHAIRPVVRDRWGNVIHKSWNIKPISNYIGLYPECMRALVRNYFDTVTNIGADIFYQELDHPVYEALVQKIFEHDVEVAVDFARYLSPDNHLFKDIITQAIEKDLDITPLIGIIYTNSPDIYRLFAQKQALRPTKKGLTIVLEFYSDVISGAKDKSQKRLEFTDWLDVVEKYLQVHPRDVDFLMSGYKLFKQKNEGASAYLLKEVIKRHAPSLFSPAY